MLCALVCVTQGHNHRSITGLTATLRQLGPYSRFESEIKLGNSRIDFLLERPSFIPSCDGGLNGGARPSGKVFLEVKSVTLSEPHHGISGVTIALFPDTVGSAR
jgi:DNA-binding sugar fermentation-stimulating protein